MNKKFKRLVLINMEENKLWNSLTITKERNFITVNGIIFKCNRNTIGWLINVLAVYCNFRKAYMEHYTALQRLETFQNKGKVKSLSMLRIDQTTKEKTDLLDILGLSKHFGCIMTKETVEYVNSWGITGKSHPEQFSLKLGKLFGYFIPNENFPSNNQERLDIKVNIGHYNEVYVSQQINETNINEFYQHINKVIDMYQKILHSIGLKQIVKVNVELSIKLPYRIIYDMSLDEFYEFKKNPDKQIKVEYTFH